MDEKPISELRFAGSRWKADDTPPAAQGYEYCDNDWDEKTDPDIRANELLWPDEPWP